ncbi:MAG: V-type ATP synthase subunit D [Lentisphaerae bacterium]|jgi:V/A-type H+/Na+-transporting ATPase subunit D|nr:V-type ATP synthase subunit D [Lentisphaerota bacterium]MBT4821012.1 V-type ATP synthase subunit D [Lentisphaerota bacterium]MBT5607866.1 V-type ATP synthase subunit D [Lentisphaerota bacterium]MBT7054848.1 V-type ATP synthase subunit D [Lentisphaerota bacterium]MBT7845588.1 V-type ATP synthase subunit D [Lentisphaerota bacterium]
MATKLKLTKDSLSREKKALARFSRFLPTLKLRKTQLFNEIHRIHQDVEAREAELLKVTESVTRWVAVFAAEIDLTAFCAPQGYVVRRENVAGIEIPVLGDVRFQEEPYDLMEQPFWLDAGLQSMKQKILMELELNVLREQLEIISEELRTTVQRINLFEKVKIPQAKENIRKIRIFLGDQQTAGVVRGKLTKGKLTRKRKARAATAQG